MRQAVAFYSSTGSIVSIINISIPSYCRCPLEGSQRRTPGNSNNAQLLVNGRLPSSWEMLDSREQQAKDGENSNEDAPNMHTSNSEIEWG